MSHSLLHLPAGGAAKTYLLHLCKQADAACSRLSDAADEEALHDFRVAIRRMRTWLRAYHLYLPIGKSLRKRLRTMVRRTNVARDAEVAITGLQGFAHELTAAQRVGLNWLLVRLEEARQQAYADILTHIPQDWPPVARDLRHQLRQAGQDDVPAITQVAFELAASADAELAQKLTAIGGLQDMTPIHQARIAAKRLRYLLEPFRKDVHGIKEAVDRLSALQDAVGELHDGYVLQLKLAAAVEEAARLRARRLMELTLADPADTQHSIRRGHTEQTGLLALARLLALQQQQRFADAQSQYLARHVRSFLGDVELPITHLNG